MQVIGLRRFGGPEVLEMFESRDPDVPAGQVRIRVLAAAVNPADLLFRAGAYAERITPFPAPWIPGMDAAGTVDEIGPGTDTDLTVGDAVMAMVFPLRDAGGAYAQKVVVPASWVSRAPSSTSHAEAASLPANGLTALLAMDTLKLEPGRTLAVTGGAGGVGGYVIQLAKHLGLRVVADSYPGDEELIRRLGADHVVRRGPESPAGMRHWAGRGVDAAVDAGLLGRPLLYAVRDGGHVITVRGAGRGSSAGRARSSRNILVEAIALTDYLGHTGKLKLVGDLAQQTVLTPRLAGGLPAHSAPDAHRQLEAGGTRGRIVLAL